MKPRLLGGLIALLLAVAGPLILASPASADHTVRQCTTEDRTYAIPDGQELVVEYDADGYQTAAYYVPKYRYLTVPVTTCTNVPGYHPPPTTCGNVLTQAGQQIGNNPQPDAQIAGSLLMAVSGC